MPKNQTSFKPGISGNMKGAPRRAWTWSSELQKALERSDESGESYKKVISRALVKEAVKGNISAIKIIMDRMDGLSRQEISMESTNPIIVFDESLKQ